MPSTNDHIVKIFDSFLKDHCALEARVNTRSLDLDEIKGLEDEIYASSHEYAARVLKAVGPPVDNAWSDAAKTLHQHDLHKRILLQSKFIGHAYRKPNGYAGDKDLMRIIYANEDQGASAYAVIKNRVYQELPAAEAVRRRIQSIERQIDELPNGSQILSLACGPAREVARSVAKNPGRHRFDLIDHDPSTIAFTSNTISDSEVRHVVGNAFEIMRGKKTFLSYARIGTEQVEEQFSLVDKTYDFIYSAGLYDYIGDSPANQGRRARTLTRQLFALLKPGGRLLIGNFLSQSDSNPHLMHHRLMMELYSEWNLIYRTRAEIHEFAAELPGSQTSVTFYNEFLEQADPRFGVIGFINIQRLE